VMVATSERRNAVDIAGLTTAFERRMKELR
jgi:hypothetical protein